jgi:hypothetical protein
MPKTKIIVRCVPERAEFIRYLRKRIPEAIYYFCPERDAVAAFIGALELAGDGAAVHMEDDVILTRDFRKKLEKVIYAHPETVIQFFSMRTADLAIGSRLDRNFIMNQCVYLPAFRCGQSCLHLHSSFEALRCLKGHALTAGSSYLTQNCPRSLAKE